MTGLKATVRQAKENSFGLVYLVLPRALRCKVKAIKSLPLKVIAATALSAAVLAGAVFSSLNFSLAQNGGAPDQPGGVPGSSSGSSSGSSAGSSGSSSPGSEGMADTDAQYLKETRQALKKGINSRDYIGSLIGLGMHYNRTGKANDARMALLKALTIIDGGALKPTKGSVKEQAPTVVDHGDGTVSATINKPPSPYEETLEQLLPALVEAETQSNHLTEGEVHIKRFITMAQTERIQRVPNLMFAYTQYSALLTKMHRTKEAAHYKQEADKINSTIRGL